MNDVISLDERTVRLLEAFEFDQHDRSVNRRRQRSVRRLKQQAGRELCVAIELRSAGAL